MHELADHSNNSRNYRRRLEATALPAIPFLGRILTDVTFVKEGNRPYRESPIDPSRKLINFNRYNFLAKILGGA
jgi:son of sevenless-like protein